MKIALLNDTHFGCRNDSPAFIKYQNRFYDELFFPYLIENKIDTLVASQSYEKPSLLNATEVSEIKKIQVVYSDDPIK